jgi:hypothetical protein
MTIILKVLTLHYQNKIVIPTAAEGPAVSFPNANLKAPSEQSQPFQAPLEPVSRHPQHPFEALLPDKSLSASPMRPSTPHCSPRDEAAKLPVRTLGPHKCGHSPAASWAHPFPSNMLHSTPLSNDHLLTRPTVRTSTPFEKVIVRMGTRRAQLGTSSHPPNPISPREGPQCPGYHFSPGIEK